MTGSFTKAVVCVVVLAAIGGFAQGATIGFWQFNEQLSGGQTTGVASEILDSSGNGHHGNAAGNPLPSYVAGYYDLPSAIALTRGSMNDDPNEDRIVVPHDDAFNFNLGAGDDFTIEAMIRTTTHPSAIVSKRNHDPKVGGPGYCLRISKDDGFVGLYLQGTSDFTYSDAMSVTSITDGNWHHVAAVIDVDATTPDNNVAKIYVDWVLDATVLLKDISYYETGIGEDLSNDYDVWIGDFGGRADHNNDQFVGDIDAVRISSGALTPEEFLQGDEPPPIPGDANLDKIVNDADASILAAHWQQSGAEIGWGDGDFDGNNIVNDADASILAAHWQESQEGAAPVPEPSTIVLLAVGGLAMVIIRQRRLGFHL